MMSSFIVMNFMNRYGCMYDVRLNSLLVDDWLNSLMNVLYFVKFERKRCTLGRNSHDARAHHLLRAQHSGCLWLAPHASHP